MRLGDGATPESPARYQPANIPRFRACYSMRFDSQKCRRHNASFKTPPSLLQGEAAPTALGKIEV